MPVEARQSVSVAFRLYPHQKGLPADSGNPPAEKARNFSCVVWATGLFSECSLNTIENRHVKQSPADYRILIHPAPLRLGVVERFCAGTNTDS
jgi:hypothetical protein